MAQKCTRTLQSSARSYPLPAPLAENTLSVQTRVIKPAGLATRIIKRDMKLIGANY